MREELAPTHGATDSGPEPRHDFSSNANPLPPCRAVLDAVRGAVLTRYPDPSYTRLRSELAAHHGVDRDRIIVGSGASELILRLVRRHAGTVSILGPTFSEYARCARLERRPIRDATRLEDILGGPGGPAEITFVCLPNNPTGDLWPVSLLAQAAATRRLVVDLAYAPLCSTNIESSHLHALDRAIRLHAPNKAFGLTGVRAAYLVMPEPDPRLAWLGASWVLDPVGEAFLRATITPEAQRWLADCRPRISALRAELAQRLRTLGFQVRESPATFLLVRVGDAASVTRVLRDQGLRVRDGSSFGLPEHIRVSAVSPEAHDLLIRALAPAGTPCTRTPIEEIAP